jgi:hypothetical protein
LALAANERAEVPSEEDASQSDVMSSKAVNFVKERSREHKAKWLMSAIY